VLYVYWELLRFIAPNFAVSGRGVYKTGLVVTHTKPIRESLGRHGFLLKKVFENVFLYTHLPLNEHYKDNGSIYRNIDVKMVISSCVSSR
jgi:hypothetical protein